jgi:uncharacterized protein (TIGR02246 family)
MKCLVASRTFSLPALGLLMAAPLFAQTRVPPDLRRAMDQRIAAVAQADVATWDRLTADNFVQILQDGTTRTKAQRLAVLRASQPGPAAIVTNERVQMLGNTALQRYQVPGVWVLAIWTMNRGMWRVTLTQVSPVSGDSATVRQAIDANLVQFAEAFKRGDAEGLAAIYTEDAVQLNPNMPPWVGGAAIKQAFTGFFSNVSVTDAKFTTHDIIISGEHAIERGTYALRFRPKSGAGNEMTDSGKYLTVWERQPDGTWKIVRDITNPDAPASN